MRDKHLYYFSNKWITTQVHLFYNPACLLHMQTHHDSYNSLWEQGKSHKTISLFYTWHLCIQTEINYLYVYEFVLFIARFIHL